VTGLPTLTVELEDGSGNFTNDVTQYVRLDKGWSLSRGWSDENDEDDIQPAILRLRLDNTDGKFTLGASNFNGITKHKRIRLTRRRWAHDVPPVRGLRERLADRVGLGAWATWRSRGDASDRFMRLNRRKLRSMTEHEIMLDAPALYYTLGEPAGRRRRGTRRAMGVPL
jgi:hypothetical protein